MSFSVPETIKKDIKIDGVFMVKNVIDSDVTIPSGYTALMGNTEIATGVTVTVDGDVIVL